MSRFCFRRCVIGFLMNRGYNFCASNVSVCFFSIIKQTKVLWTAAFSWEWHTYTMVLIGVPLLSAGLLSETSHSNHRCNQRRGARWRTRAGAVLWYACRGQRCQNWPHWDETCNYSGVYFSLVCLRVCELLAIGSVIIRWVLSISWYLFIFPFFPPVQRGRYATSAAIDWRVARKRTHLHWSHFESHSSRCLWYAILYCILIKYDCLV